MRISGKQFEAEHFLTPFSKLPDQIGVYYLEVDKAKEARAKFLGMSIEDYKNIETCLNFLRLGWIDSFNKDTKVLNKFPTDSWKKFDLHLGYSNENFRNQTSREYYKDQFSKFKTELK